MLCCSFACSQPTWIHSEALSLVLCITHDGVFVCAAVLDILLLLAICLESCCYEMAKVK